MLWLTGSLDGRGWDQRRGRCSPSAPCWHRVLLVACGPALRMMEMGDDTASALGVRGATGVRLALLAAAVLLVAARDGGRRAGLLRGARRAAARPARLTRAPGPNLRAVAWASGAALLVAADLRRPSGAFAGHQLPVGVVTGVLGGGYLVWLLATERKAGRL